ncbi:hypothetical protein pEaSNUABM28_00293 [Erwinia phage pEa_SNUABM_28]|nr:hypothetical protein pEaSNUABM28_00293 [Erwinia phage pEa_SNUABM_28]QZE59194.1 hypothetical protein pEaSNUABM18_00291 [Erwinia phage pEa_SNUABM_18]
MKKNEIKLSAADIAAGIICINEALAKHGLSCAEGDVGYETVYTDDHGETQGGWYAEFDKKSRDKLRESKQVSWRNCGMLSGDTIDSILRTIDSLKFRNHAKEPTPLQLKMAENVKSKVEATKAALEVYNSAAPLSDSDLRLCIEHFRTLDKAAQADPMLALCKLHVTLNLETLLGYKEARKRK